MTPRERYAPPHVSAPRNDEVSPRAPQGELWLRETAKAEARRQDASPTRGRAQDLLAAQSFAEDGPGGSMAAQSIAEEGRGSPTAVSQAPELSQQDPSATAYKALDGGFLRVPKMTKMKRS